MVLEAAWGCGVPSLELGLGNGVPSLELALGVPSLELALGVPSLELDLVVVCCLGAGEDLVSLFLTSLDGLEGGLGAGLGDGLRAGLMAGFGANEEPVLAALAAVGADSCNSQDKFNKVYIV